MNARFVPITPRRKALHSVRGLTLMETVIAIGILALTTMGGVATYYQLNRYAANLRNMSMARALCQERIEQAITLPFRPASALVPAAPSADPGQPGTLAILGTSANYGSTGAFTGGANDQTTSELIPVYTQSTGTAAANSANVTYKRVTTVSPTALVSTGASPTSLNVVLFQVTVNYVFRSRSYTTSMTTLRGPD